MTLLGYERGEAAATVPIRFQAELDRLLRAGQASRGVADDPIIRQRLAWCYSQGADHALHRHAHADQVPARPPSGPRRRRSPSCTGASTTRSSPSCRSTSSAPTRWRRRAPPVDRVPDRRRRRAEQSCESGSARSSTPGPARSTPARRRSSATSSARWCSACRRSRRRPSDGRGEVVRSSRRSVRRRPSVGCGRRRCVNSGRRCLDDGGDGRPFLPVPAEDYVRFRMLTQYGAADHRIEAARCAELPLMVQAPPTAWLLDTWLRAYAGLIPHVRARIRSRPTAGIGRV